MELLASEILSEPVVSETANLVGFKTSHGLEVQAAVVRLAPQSVTFETTGPICFLQLSEVLTDFRILADTRALYSGKAVVRSLMNTGTVTLCEVTLAGSLLDQDFLQFSSPGRDVPTGFKNFLDRWQGYYKISPAYKLAVGDLHTLLSDLRLWSDQVELGIRSAPAANRIELERDIARELCDSVVPAINGLFDRFEEASDDVDEDLRQAHRSFGRRKLHPLLLCAPFMYRTYSKPLGFAGDYEMMNMIIRNDLEGGSLFAKLVNAYLLDQPPPHAVRNRVAFLNARILEETSRVVRAGRKANIFCLACGPAREVEDFLAGHALADQAQFRLLDFNEETLRYTGNRMEEVRRQHGRRTPITLVKNSVHHLLKDSGRPVSTEAGYDLIYCSGLYDYLSDRVCKALNTYLYNLLLPGGLLVIGNFAPHTPRQNLMEHLMEWFLIYRDRRQIVALAPEQAAAEDYLVRSEPSGANIFLEVRKPG